MAGGLALVLIFSFLSNSSGKTLSADPEILAQAASGYEHGDFASCGGLLEKISPVSLLNPDAALFLRAQCRFYSGKLHLARKDFQKLQKHFPESTHSALAAWREADCAWELGLKKTAVMLYARAQSRHLTTRADPAVGLARRAQWFYLHGRQKKAYDLWFTLRKNHPLHPMATDPPAGLSKAVFNFDQYMQLAEALKRRSSPHKALEVLEPIEPKGDRQKYRFLKLAGMILFDTRENYLQAAQLLFQVRDHARLGSTRQQAWFYGSRALGRANRDEEAIASHLAMVEKYPDGKYSARALFYAGWLYVNKNRCEDAQPILHRVERQYPSSRWAENAAWFSAWCDLCSGNPEKAEKTLKDLSTLPGYEHGGKAAYWRAVALDRSGHHHEAIKGFLSVLARHPLTWYSWLARIRLGKQAPPLAAPPEPIKAITIHDPLVQKYHELISAKLFGFASDLLKKNERRFLSRHHSDAGLLALMQMYTKAKNANRPWHLALTRRRKLLRTIPDARGIRFWRYAYPAYHRTLLIRYSRNDTEMSLFLQAIMRTESGFDQMALSTADARGLMQMLPATARQAAEELGLDNFRALDLFSPETNIQTAAYHIGRIVKRFKRQWPLAAAAYNGGLKTMCEWLSESTASPIDEFVERIPYTESRRYAKRVFTAMLRYAWLEKSSMPRLMMHMDKNCDLERNTE